jgi:cytochrome c-type biogenesis protein CcmE
MHRARFVVGGIVIAAGLAFLILTGFSQAAAAHTTLAGLLEPVGERITAPHLQLGGSTVVAGSIAWDEYRSRPDFTITDGQRTLRVRYVGSAVLPDTFQDRAQVVLDGSYDAEEGIFNADVVYAKCPSKYEGQSYDEHRETVGQG